MALSQTQIQTGIPIHKNKNKCFWFAIFALQTLGIKTAAILRYKTPKQKTKPKDKPSIQPSRLNKGKKRKRNFWSI
jgi:hypothetical protein